MFFQTDLRCLDCLGVDLVLPVVSDCMKLVLCFWLFSVLLDRFGLMKFQVV